MNTYREAGVDLIQARGSEGRFQHAGVPMRLGVFNSPDNGWYIGVHTSSGRFRARLSLEFAKTQKEAVDMLKYGFFLRSEDSPELVEHLQKLGLLAIPALSSEPR